MKKVRMAVLGCGPRGTHLSGIYAHHPQLQITAFCDTAYGLAKNAADRLNSVFGSNAAYFTSYDEMLKSAAFDALFIASDPDTQVDYACAAMKRGIHVMTEVPAAYTIKQCCDLVSTVKSTGAKYQLAEQTRYWNFIRLWREMAQRGEFGKILYAEGEYLHYEPQWDYFRDKITGLHINTNDPSYHTNPIYEPTWRYRYFAHPIFYLPHELSPLLSVTGGRIKKVCCFGTKPESYSTKGFHVRDIETALMYNTDDVIFSLRAGFTSPFGGKNGTGAHWYQVKGTERSVEWCRSTLDNPKMFTPESGWTEQDWTLEDPDADEFVRMTSHGGADFYPIDTFVDAILNDKIPPMDVYRAVETAAPAILAAESAECGGIMLEVPDFRA
jgi:Predicted dehydrogenases and related proteins